MIEKIPRISVLVVTYNQEKFIEKALDSLLSQRDYIYEICVSDDCSKDNTWNILKEYSQQYPGLFKLNRNEQNLGIFENVEKTWTMPSGDMVYRVAGDDECGEGWFEKVINFIQDNHIDYKNELFCIYGDYKSVYPNGDSYIFKNDLIITGKDTLRLSLRGLIGNRGACYSINVLKRYIKVSQGRSHIAEDTQDRQLQIFSQKNYYIPYVGNIYYANIGVSVHIDKVYEERKQIKPYLLQLLNKVGITICKKDKLYFKYYDVFYESRQYITLDKIIKTTWCYIKSIDLSLGLRAFKIRRTLFAVLRRIPHKKPISM